MATSYKTGDKIIYPHHGASIVVRKEKREFDGKTVMYLVVQTEHDDMLIRVPSSKVDEIGIRFPLPEEDIEEVLDLLRKRNLREPSVWSRRYKNHDEKLKSGDVYEVAEVLRNLVLRDKDKGLSSAEVTQMKKAEKLLISELAYSLNTDEAEVHSMVMEALS